MKAFEYAKMAAVEDAMWWYRGLHANLMSMVTVGERSRIADIGCGTGGFIRKNGWGAFVVGLDLDEAACHIARAKTKSAICVGTVNALPFINESFDLIFSADVIGSEGVDQDQALREFSRCLSIDGILVLNLPAYPWLKSEHDRAVSNARRYTRGSIDELLRRTGFTSIRVTHWNTILFPLMLLRRLLFSTSGSDVMPFPAPVNLLFSNIMKLENLWLRSGRTLSFGGSVLAVAQKLRLK